MINWKKHTKDTCYFYDDDITGIIIRGKDGGRSWWIIQKDIILEHGGHTGGITGCKNLVIDKLKNLSSKEKTLFDYTTETKTTVTTEKVYTDKGKKNDRTKGLNMALWFITQMGSVDKAKKTFGAAIAAYSKLEG